MSPLAVLTGIIMGSAVTISLGLAMVLVVFLVLSGEHPRLTTEYATLLRSFGLFFVLALCAAYAFVGLLRSRAWRWYAQAATWIAVAGIAVYYWPSTP
jgi:O-antigen ligase